MSYYNYRNPSDVVGSGAWFDHQSDATSKRNKNREDQIDSGVNCSTDNKCCVVASCTIAGTVIGACAGVGAGALVGAGVGFGVGVSAAIIIKSVEANRCVIF
jgi:hypothetical protein